MSPPLAARRFLTALLLGCVLGLFYGFLRPLRRKRHWPADLLFVAVMLWVWVYLMFGVCAGDLRFGYTAGLLGGLFVWERSAGQLLRPVFDRFWHAVGRILAWLLLPVQKILKKFCVFAKNLFALRKKWGTIKWKKM